MSPWRQRLQQLLPPVVSAGALWAVLRQVDLRALGAALSWKIATVLLPALLVYGAATLAIEALCLVLLVRPRRPDFTLWTAARIKCASYLLLTLHYALGVGALSVLLRRRTGLPLGESAGITVLIFAADVLAVFALASGGIAVLGLDLPARWILLGLLAAVAGGLFLLRASAPLGRLERLRQLSFFDALRQAPLSQLLRLLLLRGIFSGCFVSVAGAAFLAFDLSPELPRLVAGILIVAMVSALPIAVGGLGTSQIAFVTLFQGLAERERLLAVSLMLSAGLIALRVGMGVLFAREYAREALSEAGS